MKTFSIKAAFKRGWRLLKANEKLLIASTFIMAVTGALQSILTNRHALGFGFSVFIIIIAYYVFATILKIGFIKMYLKLEDSEPTVLRELLSYSNLFLEFLLASVLYMLLVLAGTILLVIPGIYWAVKYLFVPIIVVDEHVTMKQAFKRSAELTVGVKWKLIWLFILVVLTNILGAIVLLVGLFVSIPVTMLAVMHVYRTLQKAPKIEVSAA